MESCLSCGGACCRNYSIPITHADLKRLSNTGLLAIKCVEWIPVGALNSVYPDVRLTDGYYYMALRRSADGTCALSVEVEGSLRCSAHGRHPIVCQIYPFDEISGGLMKKKICRQTTRPYRFLRHLGLKRRDELFDYELKVRRWNTTFIRRREPSDFLEYLLR